MPTAGNSCMRLLVVSPLDEKHQRRFIYSEAYRTNLWVTICWVGKDHCFARKDWRRQDLRGVEARRPQGEKI